MKWSTGMKNLSCQERVKKEEILSHIALRQYFMQSLCHLNLTPYTVFETNVVACHITAEHSSKLLDWRQILFPKSFSTPHDNQNGCSSEH